jgi:uncharacterized protein (AIM24 family)
MAAPAPVSAASPVPESIETIDSTSSVGSAGKSAVGISDGPFSKLGAKIVNKGGYDILKFELQPGSSVITNQETMAYMDGALSMTGTLGNGGLFSGLLRGVTGASVVQNAVTNPTQVPMSIYLSPFLDGSIVQVDLKAGETWKFADKSFMACTPNLKVSGDINIFNNFRLGFAGAGLTYTTVEAPTDGYVWVSAYGGADFHGIDMGTGTTTPLFINHGCFLGMLSKSPSVDFWQDYVRVGTAGGFMNTVLTGTGFIMKIQDSSPPKRPGPVKCVVLTQSLNRSHLEQYVKKIATTVAREVSSSNSESSGEVSGTIPTLFRMGFGGKAPRNRTFKKRRLPSK